MSFPIRYVASFVCVAVAALALQFVPQAAHTSDVPAQVDHRVGSAQIIRGSARVIDGDTIDVGGKRVRLEGIDAPEINQFCLGRGSRRWPAGRVAANSLAQWVRGHDVICRQVGRDGFGRVLGRCRAGNKDLNTELVRAGLAWAFRKYSREFVRQEQAARASGEGVWSRSCEPAWLFRANRHRKVASKPPSGCVIKGNITRVGRIYHMPQSPWYGRTRIELAKGERWFCDERQAQAAGWRPAFVR